MVKSKLVLCVHQSAVNNLDNIPVDKLAFLDRSIVDNKEDLTIGKLFPQIIPVILVKNKEDRYLTYARNGNETRLHGSRSLLIGGHIDIEDINLSDIKNTIIKSALRELEEEIGLSKDKLVYDASTIIPYQTIIYSNKDEVSQVHLGLLANVLVNEEELNYSNEIHDVLWLAKEELINQVDQYEEWSQIVINNL